MNKKVDVIIPVYKIDGLRESLMSINKNDYVVVWIVDDGLDNDYSSILEEFSSFFGDIQIFFFDVFLWLPTW